MAFGLDDEFDYLEGEDNSTEQVSDAPVIKGATTPQENSTNEESEDSKEETAKELAEEEKETEKKIYNSVIFVVKVTTNKEDKAVELIADKVKKKDVGIYAVARPHGLRGYILLEAPDREHAEGAVFNLPYVKGIIPKLITYGEVKTMLEPVAADVKIEKNDIIEIISEPFKKEKAKVVRVDKSKNEAVVSLLGAAVPIPVTVKLDNLRVIRREEEE